MKIIIGKNKENNILIEFPDISPVHCSIEGTEYGYYMLNNLDAANRTFINGKRIKTARLYLKDTLRLASHEVDTTWLFNEIAALEKKLKTDFRKEFEEVKEIYKQHQKQVKKIDWEYGKKTLLLKVVLGLIPLLIGIIIPGNTVMRLFIVSISPVAISFFIFFQQKKAGIAEKKEEENIEFQLKYRCPKCGLKFGMMHWKLLEAEKICSKCKAVFAD